MLANRYYTKAIKRATSGKFPNPLCEHFVDPHIASVKLNMLCASTASDNCFSLAGKTWAFHHKYGKALPMFSARQFPC